MTLRAGLLVTFPIESEQDAAQRNGGRGGNLQGDCKASPKVLDFGNSM